MSDLQCIQIFDSWVYLESIHCTCHNTKLDELKTNFFFIRNVLIIHIICSSLLFNNYSYIIFYDL